MMRSTSLCISNETFVRLAALALVVALAVSGGRIAAQTVENASQVKRVALDWVGMGAEGNQRVADTVSKTANSIGYVEFIYALQHELSFGAVRNSSGEYVTADLDSVTAAAKAVGSPAGNGSQTSITNASGKHTYPIATLTWVLLPADGKDVKKQDALRELVRWMLTAGQKQCESLGYAPLPGDLAARELQALGPSK
jgi:phosphate transport system substrate-binding protein